MTSALPCLRDRLFYTNPKSGRHISYWRREPAGADAATRTMVFMHGFNGNSRSWYYQFIHFRACRLISVDAPGFGDTSVFDGGIAGFADEVAMMLSDLGLRSVWMIGHSMGGMVAQILAACNNSCCAGLILSCTHKGRAEPKDAPFSDEVIERIEQRSRLNDKDYGTLRIGRMLTSKLPPEVHDFLVSIAGEIRVEGIKWGGAAIQYLDTTPYLENIKSPTLILSAANDIVVKKEALNALIASLPAAKHMEISGVGHAPYCEDANKFNLIIQQFITNHEEL